MTEDIDLIIENIREYCDGSGIPFPVVTTYETADEVVVTMIFKGSK